MPGFVEAARQQGDLSIGDRLGANKGVGPNFGLLRMAAAVAVLVSHSFEIVDGTSAREPLWIVSHGSLKLGTLAVCVFFAMSGFLVTPSFVRSRSVTRFFLKRGIRLVPALAVAMIGLVLVIGLWSTSLDIKSYLSDRTTWQFLLTELHRAAPLPDVFRDTPLPGVVNGSLWTLKFEAVSYILLAGIGWMALLRRPFVVLLFTIAVTLTTAVLANQAALSPKTEFLLQFMMFFEFFMAGVTVAIFADRIVVSWPLLLVAAIVTSIAIVTGCFFLIGPISLSFLVIGFGVQTKIDFSLKQYPRGDYSYGTYLWAFPIQQIVQEHVGTLNWFGNVLVSLPLTLLVAAASWHLIEKPSLDVVNAGLLSLKQRRAGQTIRRRC